LLAGNGECQREEWHRPEGYPPSDDDWEEEESGDLSDDQFEEESSKTSSQKLMISNYSSDLVRYM